MPLALLFQRRGPSNGRSRGENPPFHGTRFSVRIVTKGQEDTHESWQKTVSGWTLESISFPKES